MLSPCSHVSRPQRASTVAIAAAQWPQQLRRPHHTSPMPPLAALQHPAGQLQPHPLGAHSTTSRSRPCGLQHPLLRLQTGHPWPLNKLLQNLGLTLPWRQRDKGGPSPLPEARTPWGGGEDVSMGPLQPSSICTPAPWSPGGERWTLARQGYILCQHAQLHARKFMEQRHAVPSSHGFGSEWLGCLVNSTLETKQPSHEDSPALPCPSPEAADSHPAETRLATDLELPTAGKPKSPHLGMQSLLRMCACSRVCVFICMSLFKKQPSLWGSWTLHVRVSPKPFVCYPSPQGPALPHTLLSACTAVLHEKRFMGNSRTLLSHPQCLPAGAACMPSPEPRGTSSLLSFPLLMKEKKEF